MDKIEFKNNAEPAINDANLNLLQDNIEKAIIPFESGVWTPTLADVASTSENPTVTYSSRVGNYTKIGNIVIATFNITGKITALTTNNYAAISGLPFNIGRNWDGFGSMYRAYNLVQSGGLPAPFVVNQDSRAIIQLQNSKTIGSVDRFSLSGTGTFECSGGVIYYTND